MAEETKDQRTIAPPVLLAHRVAEDMRLGPDETARMKNTLAGLAMRLAKNGGEPTATTLLAALEDNRQKAEAPRPSFREQYAGILDGLRFQEVFDNFDQAWMAASSGNHHALQWLRSVMTDKQLLEAGIGDSWAAAAAAAGNVEMFRVLKEMGHVFSRKEKPDSVFHLDPAEEAGRRGHLAVLLFLKENGADIARMKDGASGVLRGILPYTGGNREVVDKKIIDCAVYVAQNGAGKDAGSVKRLFDIAVQQGDREAVTALFPLRRKDPSFRNPITESLPYNPEDAARLFSLGVPVEAADKTKFEAYMQAAQGWRRCLGDIPPPESDLLYKPPAGVSPKVLLAVADILASREQMERKEAFGMAYEASLLFSSEEQLVQYLKKWGQPVKKPLHDLLYHITTPETGRDSVDFKAWGDAILRHGPNMAKLIKFADKLSRPLQGRDGAWSLSRTRAEIGKFAYSGAAQNPSLAALCFTHQMTEKEFNEALAIVQAKKDKNSPSNLPAVSIDGNNFGLPGASFRKLGDGDLRGLVLGELTDCCQSLGKAGEACAKHGFSSENGGFYVVALRAGEKEEEIIGQSWAWRGKQNELVLDSLETLGTRVSEGQWSRLLTAFSKELADNAKDITALHLGKGGNTPERLPFDKAASPAVPKDYSGYRDSKQQLEIWRRASLKRQKAHKSG